jgi:hypothetical protein
MSSPTFVLRLTGTSASISLHMDRPVELLRAALEDRLVVDQMLRDTFPMLSPIRDLRDVALLA